MTQGKQVLLGPLFWLSVILASAAFSVAAAQTATRATPGSFFVSSTGYIYGRARSPEHMNQLGIRALRAAPNGS